MSVKLGLVVVALAAAMATTAHAGGQRRRWRSRTEAIPHLGGQIVVSTAI